MVQCPLFFRPFRTLSSARKRKSAGVIDSFSKRGAEGERGLASLAFPCSRPLGESVSSA